MMQAEPTPTQGEPIAVLSRFASRRQML